MEKQRNERTSRICFRCKSVDHLISKCPKPPKDNKKRQKHVRFNKRGNCASQKESENGDDDYDQKIYVSTSRMSGNDKSSNRYFGESSQLTNRILD